MTLQLRSHEIILFVPVLTLTTASPSLKPETVSESPNIKKWVENYLWVGETIMDQSVALMGASGYFERKR